MRKILYFIPLALLAFFFIHQSFQKELAGDSEESNKAESIAGAIEDMVFTSSDVDLGYIPHAKWFSAIKEAKSRVAKAKASGTRTGASLTNAKWKMRGPNNIGGRTRAIMIDQGDPNRNRIWIGSVSGGLWRTEDITQSDPQWEMLALDLNNIAIGSIAQDPNDFNVIYVGTGEGFPNIDAVTGAGIFKSTDDGATWEWLPSTQNSNFDDVHEIYVHTNGDVYACTSIGGVRRSKDGGETWEKVLGTSLSGASNNNFYDFTYNEINQTFYASNANSIFKSLNGDRGDWNNIGTSQPGFPNNLVRVEMAVCYSNPDAIYVLGSVNGSASDTYVSNDGGASWTTRQAPGNSPGDDFTNGQAWYDLDIAADPFNCGRLIAGGVRSFESSFQGISWTPLPGNMHADQHNITFDPKIQGRVLFGNDGGIWLSENGGQTITNKNFGYATTQFYCGAIHPDESSPYIIGGTQDNGSPQIISDGFAEGNSVWGGDGVFCFIDQNDPTIQIVSSQNGNYGLSTNGGQSFNAGVDVNGSFINRSGYDDDAQILYGQLNTNGKDYFRWNVISGAYDEVNIINNGLNVTAIKADPNTPNRMFFGGDGGKVLRVDNANIGDPTSVEIANLPVNAAVSSIYLDRLNENHIIVTIFNFGSALKNVWVTYDGGGEWNSIEGDLPDMPVRWALFDPTDHDRAMIATEAGVWVTDDIDGDNTHWEPIPPANGMPFVKVNMLLLRESDKVVLGVTHGRGMFTTDFFAAATPVIRTQSVAYQGQPVTIDGSQSVNAQSYEWDLGDSNMSQDPTFTHVYDEPGVYNIALTINGSSTKSQSIAILPYLPSPYQKNGADFAGDFEVMPEHFAAVLVQGTSIQRGKSTKPGKDGTHSGDNAWVLGINDDLYQNNTRAELYTPMFDLTAQGLYELKFYAKYAIENRRDGFQIEYSLDGGLMWTQLGTTNDANWYNYHNTQISDGAFPIGKSYFTNAQLNWTQYIKDISFLAGQSTVSFRYVFRSDDSEPAQGFAIDDFEVTKYTGALETNVTVFNASYTAEQEVTINWTTGIEYQCQKFILERSFTGFGFSPVATIPAKGVVSTQAHTYTTTDPSLRDIIYYRLKVVNENAAIGYQNDFYTDTIVVRKNVAEDIVYNVLPNPFKDFIGVSFSSIVDQEVSFRLFDASGRQVMEEKAVPNAVSYQIDQLKLTPGVYILTVQIGNGDVSAYKLFTSG